MKWNIRPQKTYERSLIFITSQTGNSQVLSKGRWIHKLQYVHTVWQFSARKRNKLVIHKTTWMTLKNIMLCERSQTKKSMCYCMYCMIPYIWNSRIGKTTVWKEKYLSEKKKRKLYDTENIRSVVPLGREELGIMGKCVRGLPRVCECPDLDRSEFGLHWFRQL